RPTARLVGDVGIRLVLHGDGVERNPAAGEEIDEALQVTCVRCVTAGLECAPHNVVIAFQGCRRCPGCGYDTCAARPGRLRVGQLGAPVAGASGIDTPAQNAETYLLTAPIAEQGIGLRAAQLGHPGRCAAEPADRLRCGIEIHECHALSTG